MSKESWPFFSRLLYKIGQDFFGHTIAAHPPRPVRYDSASHAGLKRSGCWISCRSHCRTIVGRSHVKQDVVLVDGAAIESLTIFMGVGSGPVIYDVWGMHWVTQKLPQIYTANHATFQIPMRKITVQICGNFWVTQCIYISDYLLYRYSLFTCYVVKLCFTKHKGLKPVHWGVV